MADEDINATILDNMTDHQNTESKDPFESKALKDKFGKLAAVHTSAASKPTESVAFMKTRNRIIRETKHAHPPPEAPAVAPVSQTPVQFSVVVHDNLELGLREIKDGDGKLMAGITCTALEKLSQTDRLIIFGPYGQPDWGAFKMKGGRVTHQDVKKQMSSRGQAAQAKEQKMKIPEGKTVTGKPEKFGGKQAPPFGK